MDDRSIPDLVMRFHQATGLDVMACKEYLRTADPDLVERILTAYDKQAHLQAEGPLLLHDPIEDDSRYADAIAEAEAEAELAVAVWVDQERQDLRAQGMEHLEFMLSKTVHLHYHTKQQILKERFGID